MSLRCSICHRNISGRYLELSDGTAICEDCVSRYPRCELCGRPSPNTKEYNGHIFCIKCLNTARERCHICGIPITGRHFKSGDGVYFCHECYESRPHCRVCGVPVGEEYHMVKGGVICPDCFNNAKIRCHICDTPIFGRHFESGNGLYFCHECYESRPHCRICRVPVGEDYQTVDGEVICPDCYMKLERCGCCNRILLPWNAYGSEFYPGKYCKECIENAIRCNDCGRPLNEDDAWWIGDGRALCNACNAIAVFDLKTANELFKEMREYLRSEFGILFDHDVRLVFTGKDRLNKLGNKNSKDGSVRGLFQRDNKDQFTIFMLKGLTKTEFQAVAAHEYTHAWQKEHCPSDQELQLVEGFATWVEYKVYKKFGGIMGAKRIEKNDDPIYGDGFRKVRQIANERGFIGLIQYVKTRNA